MEFDLNKRHCYWFNEITKIPHGSRNEKAISDFVVAFAKEHGFAYHQDAVWNVTVDKPASKGYEDARPLLLQAHMDMVAEKTSDSDHDFLKDPLKLYVKDGILHATDTTLGADDGTGVAYMLAILEDETLEHPALECVFTTMEEIGLLGAQELTPEDVHADRMISLDGGGEVATGANAAGGCDVSIDFTMRMEDNDEDTYELFVHGLTGGHSGGQIHMEKGNADIIAARVVEEMKNNGIIIHFVSLEGGSKDNAITREAKLIFTTAASKEKMDTSLSKSFGAIHEELLDGDPDLIIDLKKIEKAEKHADEISTYHLFDMIYVMPNGFQHRSLKKEMTMTSLNLGIAETNGDQVHLQTLLRSSIDSAVDDLIGKITLLGKLFDADVSTEARYPGWNYTEVSPLRDKYAEVLKEDGKELKVFVGHGGNECGVFKGLNPKLDIITFGPVARYIHTPNEELDLASFDRSFEYLKAIIRKCND